MAHLTSSSRSSNNISSKNKDEENSPLWKYVTRIEKMGEGRGRNGLATFVVCKNLGHTQELGLIY